MVKSLPIVAACLGTLLNTLVSIDQKEQVQTTAGAAAVAVQTTAVQAKGQAGLRDTLRMALKRIAALEGGGRPQRSRKSLQVDTVEVVTERPGLVRRVAARAWQGLRSLF